MTKERELELLNQLEDARDYLDQVKVPKSESEKMDGAWEAISEAMYYIKQYRGLAEPEEITFFPPYAEVCEKAIDEAGKDLRWSVGSIEVLKDEKNPDFRTFKISPTKAYFLFVWGRHYERMVQELEQKEGLETL